MIEELKKLQEKLEQTTEWEITISQELYDLLVAECNQTNKLLAFVNSQREKSTARVLSNKEILSEQVDEFDIPELWLTQYEIDEYRIYRKAERDMDVYEWTLKESELKAIDKKTVSFRRSRYARSEEAFPLSFVLQQAKWSVAVYDIIEDAYVSEFLKSMGCYSDDDIKQTFGSMTMNLMQIDRLYKHYKLDQNKTYVVFLNKSWKIDPYNVWKHRGSIHTYGPITEFNKANRQILLFYPKDLINKE